ncbi:MAG: DUF2911 domain-containing protein [Pedobacter sp.]|uniref:DUF2911 domain-containing protein n=1 Tax=Pedobacter sp. TaxID=1411316 RepID=UPI002808AADB|nr:DUF2911 domain-containing protein [Pedobacter sp.]MDQ8005129.1 DUF2911 domain-containing protein [Pedobacter sp.]
MKKFSFLMFLLLGTFAVKAQNVTTAVNFPKVDTSPLDVVYYPLNTTKSKDAIAPVMRVLYSRPQKKGREIFGVLEQFDKVWRFGANENTEIQFFKTVTIAGKKIKAGRYSIFAIPSKDKWTIIINKQNDKWGAFTYDQQNDVLRTDVVVNKIEKMIEAFSITFIDAPEGANLVAAWDNTQVFLPIAFKK